MAVATVVTAVAVFAVGVYVGYRVCQSQPPYTILDEINDSFLSPATKRRRRQLARQFLDYHIVARGRSEHDAARELIHLRMTNHDAALAAERAMDADEERERLRVLTAQRAERRRAKLSKLLGKESDGAAAAAREGGRP